jgi:hypothetical protein
VPTPAVDREVPVDLTVRPVHDRLDALRDHRGLRRSGDAQVFRNVAIRTLKRIPVCVGEHLAIDLGNLHMAEV